MQTVAKHYLKSISFGKLVGNIPNIFHSYKEQFECWILCLWVDGFVFAISTIQLNICYYFVEKLMSLEKVFWPRLILKFGLNFFGQFISETPKGHLEQLFFLVVLKS